MTDELRLQNELTFDEYKNPVGGRSVRNEPSFVVARRDAEVLMTAKMLAGVYGVDVSTIRKR
jgi:hypothetical protein